jgi:hypothetical protein
MVRMSSGSWNLLRFAYGAVAVLVVIVLLGMWIPRTIPRLAFLPAPAKRTYCSKTEGNSLETWHRSGAFWARTTISDLIHCKPETSNRATTEMSPRLSHG